MKKPSECSSCPYKNGVGFVPDYVPESPKIACVLKMPGKDEIVLGAPMVGKAGRFWEREYLNKEGLERKDVLLCNVIRCFPKGGNFPIAGERKGALEGCRRWDGALEKFRPNMWIITYNPAALMRTPQQGKLLRRSVKKAKEYADRGYRPCLLMGEEARDVFAPWAAGNMKQWQGHWWKEEKQ